MTYAEEFDCKINWVPLDENLRYDLNEISRRTSKNTSMVFICNPNNPTGTMLQAKDLEDFCTATAKKTCVFVDEAYYDYSINDGYPTMTKLVKAGHNVIVSRTFSKIYGLAGVRIGYLIASPERIDELKKCTMAGTNMLATHAAMTAYDEKSFFNYSLEKNKEALEILYNAFDEIEKAHPQVLNILLQVLDEGHLTDSKGRTVNFKNTIIVMTSNLSQNELETFLRPEFRNRIDETIRFNDLSEDVISKIVELNIQKMVNLFESNGYKCLVDQKVMEDLCKRGYHPDYGARPIKRLIKREVVSQVSKYILENQNTKVIKILYDNGIKVAGHKANSLKIAG